MVVQVCDLCYCELLNWRCLGDGCSLAFRKQKRQRRIFNSLWRLGIIALAAVIAGVSLWAIATRMFLEPPIQFTLSRDCEATPIPWSKQKIIIPKDTQGAITQIDRSYTIETEGRKGRIIESDFGFLELRPNKKSLRFNTR